MNKQEILKQINNAATKEEMLEIIKENNLDIPEEKVDLFLDKKALKDDELNNVNGGMSSSDNSGDTPKFKVGDKVDIAWRWDDDATIMEVYDHKEYYEGNSKKGLQYKYRVDFKNFLGRLEEETYFESDLTLRKK